MCWVIKFSNKIDEGEKISINSIVQNSRKIYEFFLPGGMVFIAAIFCVRQGYVEPWVPLIDKLLPYIILGIGFMLSWRFHRSRLAFVILIMVLADRVLYYFGPGGMISTGLEDTVFYSVSILLPENMAFFYFVRERGLVNLTGLTRLLFILMQLLIVYFLLQENPEVFSYINKELVSLPILARFHIPQVVLFIYGIILFTFFVGALFSDKPIMRGFFWSLLAIAAALYDVSSGSVTTLYFSVAGIIIILSMVETAYAMAYNDELTGLPARRSLNTTMQGLGRRYTIAMLDIDFFKKFNDKYGHDVGDQVLCMVASHIGRVGGGGKPFRYGGEEFTVIFPGKSKDDVITHLEALRKSIAEAQFVMRGKDRPKKKPTKNGRKSGSNAVSVTISIGAAEPGSRHSKPDQVIEAADQALYKAKKKGRNCVVG